MTTFALGRNGPMLSDHSTRGLEPPKTDYPVSHLPTDPNQRAEALRMLVQLDLVSEEQARWLRAKGTPPHTASDF